MEETALYRPILKKAWQTTKKFRNLWFFGLFVALLGMSGEYEIISRAFFNPFTNEDGIIISSINSFKDGWVNGIIANGNSWSNIWNTISSDPKTFIFIIITLAIAIAISLFFVWLGIVSQIGIIRNADINNRGKKATINEGIDFAVKRFWPILLSNAILKILLFIIFLVLGREIIMLQGQGVFGLIIYYISFVVLIIVIFTISFLIRYQILYLLLKKERYIQSFKSAWKLFSKNWLISLEMALLVFLFYILAAIITSIITVLFVGSVFVLALYFTVPNWIIIAMAILLLIIALGITFIITAILNTFQWSSWILLFNRLTKSESISKIVRFTNFSKK